MGRGRAGQLLAQLKVWAVQDTLVPLAVHSCFPFCLHFLWGVLNDFVHAASRLHWLGCGVMYNWKAGRTGLWRRAPIIHLNATVTSISACLLPRPWLLSPASLKKKKKSKGKENRSQYTAAVSGKRYSFVRIFFPCISPLSLIPLDLTLLPSLSPSPCPLPLSLPLAPLPLSRTHMHTHCFLYFSLLKFYTSLP